MAINAKTQIAMMIATMGGRFTPASPPAFSDPIPVAASSGR
jgi:hypothetical protein